MKQSSVRWAMQALQPKQWPNTESLVKDLRRYPWKEQWFDYERKRCDGLDLPTLIKESILGNTFRGLRVHLGKRPSEVFRRWARRKLEGGAYDALLRVRSRKDYDSWLLNFADSLRRSWRRQMDKEPKYGCSMKLVNLLTKKMIFYQGMPPMIARRQTQFLHVPLDHYSLVAVRNCLADFPHRDSVGEIPLSATMSFVRNPQMYNALQNGMRRIAKRAGVPAIVIDVLAWNRLH
jgi:hypothetical protein